MNTNKPSNEEVLQALIILRNLCQSYSSCENCPCYNKYGNCQIRDENPECYSLNEPEENWYAFRG